jgi:hypothetical protein
MRRLEAVRRLKAAEAACLTPAQQDDFTRTVATAQSAAENGDHSAIAAANRALDILSLELCED